MWIRVHGRLVNVSSTNEPSTQCRCYVCNRGMFDADHMRCVLQQLYGLEQLCLDCNKVVINPADHLKCLEESNDVPWVDWK